jgi:Mor family transcriptional regulator
MVVGRLKVPKVITLKRLYNGIASLRDYTVEKALKKGDGITVRCNGQEMYLSPDDLKRGERGSEKIISKFDGTSYYLVDFKWKVSQKGLF